MLFICTPDTSSSDRSGVHTQHKRSWGLYTTRPQSEVSFLCPRSPNPTFSGEYSQAYSIMWLWIRSHQVLKRILCDRITSGQLRRVAVHNWHYERVSGDRLWRDFIYRFPSTLSRRIFMTNAFNFWQKCPVSPLSCTCTDSCRGFNRTVC